MHRADLPIDDFLRDNAEERLDQTERPGVTLVHQKVQQMREIGVHIQQQKQGLFAQLPEQLKNEKINLSERVGQLLAIGIMCIDTMFNVKN